MTAVDAASIEGATWTLVAAGGRDVVPGEPGTLRLVDGQASGSTGCNRFAGGYVLDGGSISFGPLATTRMACHGELAEQESVVLAVLAVANSYELDGDQLTISSPGDRLRYRDLARAAIEPEGGTTTEGISREELQLAARNHGMPLEALRYDLTPAGLHYLLIHYDIPEVDAEAWRLHLGGGVSTPAELTLEDLRSRPSATRVVTLECAGNGRALLEPRPISQPWLLEAVGNAAWTGVPLHTVLEEAGLEEGAVEVLFTGLDRGVEGEVEQDYERALPLGEAMREDVLLAYEMNEQPLLPQHGFPVRLVVPGWYGMTHVKWLSHITVLTEPFEGYQQSRGYRLRSDPDEPGEPVDRIRPRSLMVPPGIPDFLTRRRIVDAGTQVVRGRAWSGVAPIERIEFSDDGAGTWTDARLEALPSDPFAWRGWTFEWDASPGERELCCRATDATGQTQPLEPSWNVGGYVNNAVQRVLVTVR